MDTNPESFISDTTGAYFFNNHKIVHLYRVENGWKPTKGTELQVSEGMENELQVSEEKETELQVSEGSWWGVLLNSNTRPYIADLKMYEFSNDWKLLKEADCAEDELKNWYRDQELQHR